MLADNPRGDAIIHTNIACGILGTAAVMMRFLARWKSKAPFAADDWCILASLIPSYGMMVSSGFSTPRLPSICTLLAINSLLQFQVVARGGAGRHAHTLTHDETRIFLQVHELLGTLENFIFTG